jgi:hypothetical protein
MNVSSTQDSPTHVAIELSGAAEDDAHAVFCVLCAVYESDRTDEERPQAAPGVRPMIWSATVDSSGARERPAPRRLAAPVTATLQGGPCAVEEVCRTLSAAFDVSTVGSVSGDQEQEVQLRLTNR